MTATKMKVDAQWKQAEKSQISFKMIGKKKFMLNYHIFGFPKYCNLQVST